MTAAARQRQRPLAVDDWVRRVNALARRIDDYTEGVHPGALVSDPYYQRLVQQYRDLAAAPTRDDEQRPGAQSMIIDFPAIAMDGAGGRTFVGAIALTLLGAAADLPGSGAFWRVVPPTAGMTARRPTGDERNAQIAVWEAAIGTNLHPEPLLPPITALMVPNGAEDRPIMGNPQPGGQPDLDQPDYIFAGSALILNHSCRLLILREFVPFAAAMAVLEAGALRSKLHHAIAGAHVAVQCIPYRDPLQLQELWNARKPCTPSRGRR